MFEISFRAYRNCELIWLDSYMLFKSHICNCWTSFPSVYNTRIFCIHDVKQIFFHFKASHKNLTSRWTELFVWISILRHESFAHYFFHYQMHFLIIQSQRIICALLIYWILLTLSTLSEHIEIVSDLMRFLYAIQEVICNFWTCFRLFSTHVVVMHAIVCLDRV